MALFTVAYISKPFTAHSMYILHANQLLSAAFELDRRWKCCTCRGFGICMLHETLWKQHQREKWITGRLICGTIHFWKFQMVHQFKMTDPRTNHDRNKNFLM